LIRNLRQNSPVDSIDGDMSENYAPNPDALPASPYDTAFLVGDDHMFLWKVFINVILSRKEIWG
jgi:hypothetical protein